MVYLITESWWPPGKSEKVGKKYLEVLQKFPLTAEIGEELIPAAIWALKDGMHSINILNIKSGKTKEAMDLAYQRLLMLAEIEGYAYEVTTAFDVVEAMPHIGLEAPK